MAVYVYADQDFIAPRPVAFPPPQFPAQTRPGVDDGVVSASGFGHQPVDVVPYALSGPSPGGGEQANYRFTAGNLEQHTNGSVAQAWPTQGGTFFPGVWDDGQFGQRATASGPRGSVATLFPSNLGILVNGSSNPAGVGTGATITITGTLTLAQPLAPNTPATPTESVAISVQRTGGQLVSLGTAVLQPVPGNPTQFTFSLSAPHAGAPPFNVTGTYTFSASFAGDLVNANAASNSVALVATIT